MAVRIRMTRTGRLNRPFFRIGVFDSRTRRDGRVIEQLGYYDPMLSTGIEWKVDQERLAFWMKRGALPSERITAWLRSQKIAHGGDRKKVSARRRRARQAPAGGPPSHRAAPSRRPRSRSSRGSPEARRGRR